VQRSRVKPALKVLSPETFGRECRRVCPSGRQQSVSRHGEWHGYSPGSEAVSSLTSRARGNQGDPRIGLSEAGTREQVSKARTRAGMRGSRSHLE
jgi:hypothetical protein